MEEIAELYMKMNRIDYILIGIEMREIKNKLERVEAELRELCEEEEKYLNVEPELRELCDEEEKYLNVEAPCEEFVPRKRVKYN